MLDFYRDLNDFAKHACVCRANACPREPIAAMTDHADLTRRREPRSPIELDRLNLPLAMVAGKEGQPFSFRFAWRDVPFSGAIAGDGTVARLTVTGELGPLPFTIEAARRRNRALRTLAAARRWTGLDWHLNSAQEIVVSGETMLSQPTTPGAMIAGAVGVLARGDHYLALLLDVLGDADSLNLAAAA
jgi:hypothetical protein